MGFSSKAELPATPQPFLAHMVTAQIRNPRNKVRVTRGLSSNGLVCVIHQSEEALLYSLRFPGGELVAPQLVQILAFCLLSQVRVNATLAMSLAYSSHCNMMTLRICETVLEIQ